MKCQCGFQFAGPGEFRNCPAFVTTEGKSGVVCPVCKAAYVDGRPVDLVWVDEKKDEKNERS